MNRFLVITENETFISNMMEWFKNDIKNKKIEIDIAKDREAAKQLLKKKSYNKIFHNGIYVIDLIEQYQNNADVIKQGLTKNKIFSKTISGTEKNEIDVRKDKPFYLKVSYGMVGLLLASLVSLVLFLNTMRKDVDDNIYKINKIDNKVSIISEKINSINSNVGKLTFYFEKYFDNNKKGE